MIFTRSRFKTRLEKLIAEWTQYRDMVLTRLGAKDVQAAEERRFLKLKGRLAEEITTVTMNLSAGKAQEVHVHLRSIDNLLNRFPSLMADQPLNEQVRAEFDRDWHDHFLFFNRLKSLPAPARGGDRDSPDLKRFLTTAEPARQASSGARLGSVLLRVAVLVGFAWVLIRFVPWKRMLEASDGKGGGSAGLWAGVKAAASDMKLSSLGGVLDPVINQYGNEATMVLIALLLLAIGYWIFVKMR